MYFFSDKESSFSQRYIFYYFFSHCRIMASKGQDSPVEEEVVDNLKQGQSDGEDTRKFI